jgi:hypothetical protein
MKMVKSVIFNLDKNETQETYSGDEYLRFQIDSVLYRRGYSNLVSDEEWNNIYITLDLYKLYEMKVHKDSFHNNLYHAKKLINK